MTADQLQARARALHDAAMRDMTRNQSGSFSPNHQDSNHRPTQTAESDRTPEYTGDIDRLVFASVCSSFSTMNESDRSKMAPLTPDQWFVLIGLIGEIILKIIERRNPRPNP